MGASLYLITSSHEARYEFIDRQFVSNVGSKPIQAKHRGWFVWRRHREYHPLGYGVAWTYNGGFPGMGICSHMVYLFVIASTSTFLPLLLLHCVQNILIIELQLITLVSFNKVASLSMEHQPTSTPCS